jgi:hypothetical protein
MPVNVLTHAALSQLLLNLMPGEAGQVLGVPVARLDVWPPHWSVADGAPGLLLVSMDTLLAAAGRRWLPDEAGPGGHRA